MSAALRDRVASNVGGTAMPSELPSAHIGKAGLPSASLPFCVLVLPGLFPWNSLIPKLWPLMFLPGPVGGKSVSGLVLRRLRSAPLGE
jgi:hypothetical protein